MENGLDPTSFPSCLELEKDVIGMAVDLVNGGADATGTFTSGGTESILLSLKTTRTTTGMCPDITRPEVLMPTTAHPAFHKACQYFDLTAVTVDVDDDFAPFPGRWKRLSRPTPSCWWVRRRPMPTAPSTRSPNWDKSHCATSCVFMSIAAWAACTCLSPKSWATTFPHSICPCPA